MGLPPGPYPYLVTQVSTWPFGPGESVTYLVFSQTRGLWSPPGPHLDLVNLVPIWASPSPGEFVPLVDLIAVDSFLASRGTGDSGPYLHVTRTRGFWYPSGLQLDLVTLVLNWASPGPREYAPHLRLLWTW